MKKKNKLVTVLAIILVVLFLVLAGILGFFWYQSNHIFVDKKAYSIHAVSLDLREEEISFDHYNAVHSQLPACEIFWNVPFQGEKISNDTENLSISTLTQEDIELMKKYFPNLKRVNAGLCNDYAMLESLKEQMPALEVSYSVALGGSDYEPNAESLILEVGQYSYEALTENLIYLPNVKSILLKKPELDMMQIETLRSTYPDVEIMCTVEILGKEYDTETTELDLSAMTSEQVDSVSAKLAMLPNLKAVELMDEVGGTSLSKAEVKMLMNLAPDAVFHYVFDFYGETLSTDTEEVHLKNKKIGNDGEAEVRQALDLLPNCSRFVLENCGLTNEVLAQIREDYRERTKVVWRVYFGAGSSLTDADVIRSVYDLVDDNSTGLYYCEDARYLDIGHDEYLDSIDFISGMKSLEYVIISGSPVKDLTPFENCRNLKVLEAANCSYITDISPLAKLENLEMLNISFTKVTDISPVMDKKLTHLSAMGLYKPLIAAEDQKSYTDANPDCWTMFGTGDLAYGQGWRYDEKNEPLPWYSRIKAAFRYPEAPNNLGWYHTEEE